MDGVKLRTLVNSLPVTSFTGPSEPTIRSIHYDSRSVEPGGLFVAIPGLRADGSRFIDDAIARGATAVVAERPPDKTPNDVSVIQVENARRALAHIAAEFWGHPSKSLFLIGVTGTNGKTTTAYLTEAVLRKAGLAVGVIGTIDYRFGDTHLTSTVTTPESADLMRMLREMVNAGVTHVVLEVSSHAVDLGRVASCEFDVGIFTNLSQDHLDYHRDMTAYWQCKKRFFVDHLSKGPKADRATAVINVDDHHGRELARELTIKTLRSGLTVDCDVRAENVEVGVSGTTATIQTFQGTFRLESPLVGQHNVHNVLSATGAGIAAGVPLSRIREGIGSLVNVPGRLESVPNSVQVAILVDYAHTPEALENVLTALKKLTTGRLITVFGCGGDRDKRKRPLMGEIAARFSDRCILTTDNPRTEAPTDILADIETGTASAAGIVKFETGNLMQGNDGKSYAVEPDRRLAIELGVRLARPGDCLLIAGKGHETYQLVGAETLPFDDRVEVRKALKRVSRGQRRQESAGER